MDKKITLAHGSGARATRDLIEDIILKHLRNPMLDELNDSALFELKSKKLAFTTDSYTVNPLFFPGSDIGKLSVYGTVNDLAVVGARPVFLSLSFIIEEGLSLNDFERVIVSIKEAKNNAEVEIITGDTKVVEKGKCDKLFITTSGLGISEYSKMGSISIGDKIIVNGAIGEHETSIILARGDFKFKANVLSDCASLWGVISKLIKSCGKIKFMRDATRGGVGVVLNEIVEGNSFGIEIQEDSIPLKDEVKAISELLGYDPLYLANEGRFIMIIDKDEESKALGILKSSGFHDAVTIGSISSIHKGRAVLSTKMKGVRILDYPYGTQLPRIC
ncbi:MAG: hydrogenase expression/formation protein HypE [Candidatus Saelkia tenebricola]|nr:hydrogenase expression/formation protein HypE [Candidatus Saelkia tenebricola]